MKKFIITEEEKTRILEMHQNATSRQYLMESEGNVANLASTFTNEFNRVMTAYNEGGVTGWTASYIPVDDFHGNIQIKFKGAPKVTSTKDFGSAVTKNFSPGQPNKDPLDTYGTDDIAGKLSMFSQNLYKQFETLKLDPTLTSHLNIALNSAIAAVKKLVLPTQK